MNLHDKVHKLHTILAGYKRVAVAFSGGCDSSLLLAMAVDSLGKDNVRAVTAVSETYTPSELTLSRSIAKSLAVKHSIIHTRELANPNFSCNPADRCFWCKDELFSKIHSIAQDQDMVIADGSTVSDLSDYRPGKKAALKWQVKHPLLDAQLVKDDVRKLSRKMKLTTWNMPAGACLASRIPYDESITKEKLHQIFLAERYLKKRGFALVRVRTHAGNIARIEIDPLKLKNILHKNTAQKLAAYFKKIGYRFITVDLQGYRTGSMNPR